MESFSSTTITNHPSSSPTSANSCHLSSSCSSALKKLKREAAQRRKAHARSLRLRADEQERLQRLEIEALVEQQRLERLERQRCEEDAQRLAQEEASTAHCKQPDSLLKVCSQSKYQNLVDRPCMDERKQQLNDANWPKGGKEASSKKQQQQQSMRAAVESRRRLARGPRSGTVADAHSVGVPMLPSEDHRVVSTEYQAAGTQALMRVTLLAAGFVIGARGISARLIGQVTGAIVQSWTESCRPDSVPIRLFRIQGKKVVVQAAVALIEQAVAKYKDLCDCKRRGEFVQREHIITGVEFYYQPPPRKAFANANEQPQNCCTKAGDASHGGNGNAVSSALPFAPHHVWLQHLQQQHQSQAAVQQQKQAQAAIHEASQLVNGGNVDNGHGQNHRALCRPQQGFFDWQAQHAQERQQVMAMQQGSPDSDHNQDCPSELELIEQGLQQSVASLEQALHQFRLEQRLLQHNRTVTDSNNNNHHIQLSQTNNNSNGNNNNICAPNTKQTDNVSFWSDITQDMRANAPDTLHLGSSLFSIFGNGGLPLPISPDGRSDAGNECLLGSAPASTDTPFDFPRCDFLRDSFPAFPFAREAPEYTLYGSTTLKGDVDDSLCIVCLEQSAAVRLVTCGHASFCFSCVQGLVNCPLCREKIVALHPLPSSTATTPAGPDLNSSSSYQLWNWVPGASV